MSSLLPVVRELVPFSVALHANGRACEDPGRPRVATRVRTGATGGRRDQHGDCAGRGSSPRAVALVLLPALVLMLAFAFSYVGAFHEPTPHHVPIAVVGPPAVAAQLDALPGDPLDARQASSRADALSQIDDREVYGAYDAATQPAVRRLGGQPRHRRSRWSARSTALPLRSAARRPGLRRQAAAAQGPERHRGVLRHDRLGLRRVHRRDADRVDREPTQPQPAARSGADRRARGVRHRRRDPERGHAAGVLRRVLGPRGRAVRDRAR